MVIRASSGFLHPLQVLAEPQDSQAKPIRLLHSVTEPPELEEKVTLLQ